MHNDNKNRNVRWQWFGQYKAGLAIGLLLNAVVCGVAYTTLNKDSITPVKDDAITATQTESTSLNLMLPALDLRQDAKLSAGYKIVSSTVGKELRRGRPTYAAKLLTNDPLAKKLRSHEIDLIKAQIAQSYLIEGNMSKAAHYSKEAVKRSGHKVPLAGWVAGQVAWRHKDYGLAEHMFGITAHSPKTSSWLSSGAAYWAARSALKQNNADKANEWYTLATKHPRTFYGLISLRALGEKFDFNWTTPEMTRADKKSLEQDLKVSAAIRLALDGKLSAATTMLGGTKWMVSDKGRRALLAYTHTKKVPALTLFLARKTRDEDGRFYDVALYPESPWNPKNGYEVDKALVHALIRQESRFNPHAISSTGARGLMQIMPSTANFVAKESANDLSHPETNIAIGQKYVRHLLNDKTVNNDLFKMTIAYNAGPGNLSRWKRNLSDIDDPMLFIESIPSAETRAFVERVMLNYWMYRLRMGQDVPSLDAVAMLDAPSAPTPVKTVRSFMPDAFASAQ